MKTKNRPTTSKPSLHLHPKSNSPSPPPISSIQNDTFTHLKQQELIDSILKNSTQQQSFQHLLNEEHLHNTIIQKRKKQINNITLLEQNNNTSTLYEWKTLFNNSRPLSHYTRIPKNKQNNTRNNNNNNNNDTFKFPCVLIDAPSEKFSMYFPKGSFSNKKHYNVTRAKSMNAPRENNELFYFCKELSDYYVDDLTTYAKKKRELKARKRCESAKLKMMINKTQRQTKKTEKMLNDGNSKINVLKKKSLLISNRDISLAINKKNAQPLIQSIYHQIIEENNNRNNKDNEYGNEEEGFNEEVQEEYTIDEREQSDNIDTVNGRNRENNNYSSHANGNRSSNQASFTDRKILNNENISSEYDNTHNNINNYMNNHKNETKKSIIKNIKYDTYDINDPQLGIFKQLINSNNNKNINSLSKEETDFLQKQSRNIDHQAQLNITSKLPLSSNLPSSFISSKPKHSKQHLQSPIPNPLSLSQSKLSNPQTPTRKTIPLKSSLSCHSISFKPTLNTLITQKGVNNSTFYDNESKTNDNTINSFGNEHIYSNAVPYRTQTKMQNYTYYKMNMHLKKRFNKIHNSFIDNWNDNICSYKKTVRLKKPISCIDIKTSCFKVKLNRNKMNSNNNGISKDKNENGNVNMIYFNDFIETTFPKEVIVKGNEKVIFGNNYFNKQVKGNIYDKRKNNLIGYNESNEEIKTMISYINEKGKRVKSAKIGN